MNKTDTTTRVILDSTKALAVADANQDSFFVSSPFVIAPAYCAHLILTAPAHRYRDVSFEVLRFPQPLSLSSVSSCLKGVYSRLTNIPPNEPTPHPSSSSSTDLLDAKYCVTLGQKYGNVANDRLADVYDYITITKPGNYILYGQRGRNPLIDTLPSHNQPVIIEYAHSLHRPT